MHPLVRDLYKRVLVVGRDYPTGLDHVKKLWKTAIRNPQNCPSWYGATEKNEEELLQAVHKGRYMVKEMIGVIQIKKYRTMKERYGSQLGEENRVDDSLSKKIGVTVENQRSVAGKQRD